MDFINFSDAIEEVYAIFGKKMPEERILEVAYKRVKDLPPDFMDFVIQHFEDQETMPRNLGYYLYRILWPEYLEKNPDKKGYEYGCCPLCLTEMPGYRKVWEKEKTGWGDEVYKQVVIRCACGNAPNPRNEKIYLDYELVEKGFLLKNPYNYINNPPDWVKKWTENIANCDQTPRKEHVEYSEKYVEYDF